MEEVTIQNLLRQAIRELCGVSDGRDPQLKEAIAHISKTGKNQQAMFDFIANPTTVNKIRLDAGVKGDLESKEFVFVHVRKSNRLNSSTQKRQFDNLEGLTSSCKRKRKPRSTGKPVKEPAAADESSVEIDTEIGTSSGADEPATDTAAEDASVDTLAPVDEHGTDTAAEDAAVNTAAAVDEPGTDAATEDTLVRTFPGHIEPVSSEVMADALQSSSQSTPPRPWTPVSTTNNSSPESSSTTVQPEPLLSCPLPSMAGLLNPEHASRLSNDLNQNATASQSLSSPEAVASTPESFIHEEHSPQLNNNMAIVDSDLPARSSVHTKEENPKHASAPETSPTYKRACPAVSADELATLPEAETGPSSSFIGSSSPEADTQREGFNQACLPAACTNPGSAGDPTDTTFSPKASGHIHESQQNSDQPVRATSARCHSSHDSTTNLPSITSSQTKYTTVSKEVKELYLEGDAIPTMSAMLQTCVKYHEKTADFQDGECLVTKVFKGMGTIMKPPPNMTILLDATGRDRIKQELKKDQAGLESFQAIDLWKETFRYDYVVRLAEANTRARYRDNLGALADASQAEAEAVKELVDVVSKGRSPENYRKHHRFWKFLYDVRMEGDCTGTEDAETRMLKDGLLHILVFRTGRFHRRFFNKTKDSLQIVRKWNQVYHPYIREVQMRVLAERANDLSGSTDLHQNIVRKALKISSVNWVNGTRALNKEEEQLYLASFDNTLWPEELSLQNTTDVLRDGVDGLSERNKAIYICLVPYEGPPNGKRKLDGTPASRIVVAPCPVIPIEPEDFLGVMSGQLRYTPEVGRSDKAIQGPDSKLWLDFSEITGKLSCMRTAASGTEANVALTWKRYNDQHGMNWRIEVVATKEIWPFEELVRPVSYTLTSQF